MIKTFLFEQCSNRSASDRLYQHRPRYFYFLSKGSPSVPGMEEKNATQSLPSAASGRFTVRLMEAGPPLKKCRLMPVVVKINLFHKGGDMKKQMLNYETLLKITNAVSHSRDPEEIVLMTVESIKTALDVKGCTLFLINRGTNALAVAASYGLSDEYINKGPLSAIQSIAASLEDGPVAIYDVSDDPRIQYPEAAKKEGIAGLYHRAVGIHAGRRQFCSGHGQHCRSGHRHGPASQGNEGKHRHPENVKGSENAEIQKADAFRGRTPEFSAALFSPLNMTGKSTGRFIFRNVFYRPRVQPPCILPAPVHRARRRFGGRIRTPA